MPELVAVTAEGSTAFVEVLQRCWDAGDAVLPVDPRLPTAVAHQLLASLRPTTVIADPSNPDDVAPWLDHEGRPGEGCEPGDAVVVATSGSTGEPKGAVLTHDALVASALATSARLDIHPAADRWLACLPLSHVGGLSVVIRALHTGCALEVHDRPDPERIESAARRGATRTSLVASLLDRCELSAYRTVLVGGGPAPSAPPDNVVATYGMTESGGGVVYDGRALDGVEIRIVDGEVWLRAPMLARGYRNGPPLHDAEGWFATGDDGTLDDAGVLSVHGRRGEMIVTGGEKVWPAPVEAVLAQHPLIDALVVVGRPDPRWGQAVTAVVAPSDPHRPPDLASVRSWAAEQLAPWQLPQRLELVEALGRTALGKVRRPGPGRSHSG